MDELNAQIFYGFGLKLRKITKNKSRFICLTDKGLKVIQRINGQPLNEFLNRIVFQHKVKEHLYANGFYTDRFDLSIKGQPFYIYNGGIYVSTSYLQSSESNFSDRTSFKKIVSKVAVMHSILKTFNAYDTDTIDTADTIEKNYFNADEIYNSVLEKMSCIKKNISKYKQLSDFDVMYYKNYDYYINQLDLWHEAIIKSNYEAMQHYAVENKFVAHNLLKEEYILMDRDEVYITNFLESSCDHYLVDLCSLIKRHFKADPYNPVSISEILKIYSGTVPLSSDEIKALYALFMFPDKFIKICSQYYAKKRTWIPSAFISRIEFTIKTQDIYNKFIEGIHC